MNTSLPSRIRASCFNRRGRPFAFLASAVAISSLWSASVHAQTSSVKISGAVESGMGVYNVNSNRVVAATNGAIAASSLQFSGVEDLGGGYSTQFLLRTLFNSDTGAEVSSLLFASEARVGINGPTGAVQVGRLFSLNDTFFLWNSPSSSNYAGAWNMALNGYSAYWDNAIRYTSPTWNGFTGIVEHSSGIPGNETNISPNVLDGTGTEYGLNYERGPLQLRSVLEKAYVQSIPATDYEATRVSLGGVYDFGPAKLHLAYYDEKYSGVNKPTPFDIKFAGITIPFSSVWRATVEYGYKNYQTGTSHVQFTGLGLYYNLSKSTMLLSQAVFVQNHGPLAAYTIYHSPAAPAAGTNTSGITFEMRYTF